MTPQAVVVEANRCLYCFDAPCATACPTHIDVPRFIKKIATGNLMGSARAIVEANVLGLSCSRVCPVDVLCEGSCVLHNRNERPIAIGRLQQHAMEHFYSNHGALPQGTLPQTGASLSKSVACIGAGPASLACAAELRARGVAVTIFDKRPLPGGLNTYGVARYKFTADDSQREVDLIRKTGVQFRNEIEIGKDIAIAELEQSFDAIFLGVGLGATQRLDIPGEQLPGIIDALGLIEALKIGRPVSLGDNVVVIGGGNTAIDAAIAARHAGAHHVSVLYRRSEADMSAFQFEYEHAKREGIRFVWNARPLAFTGEDHVEAVHCNYGMTIACDTVIVSIGQLRLLDLLQSIAGVELHAGLVTVNAATGQTVNSKYFAAGDCVNGGREVVDAVAGGKRAAQGILQWLT